MDGSSNVSKLRTRLEQKSEQDRQQIEELIRREYGKLSKNLQSIVRSDLSTIESAIRNEVEVYAARVEVLLDRMRRVDKALTKAWLRPVVVGLSLFLGILIGSWGLTQWLSSNIESLIEKRAALSGEIEEQQRTVERLKEMTWGVVLHEGNEGRRFVVLPRGSLEYPPWTVGGKPAIRLSSE